MVLAMVATTEQKIKLGISACLLGEPVRYNGGHQHDRYLTDTLGQFVDFIAVCPEVECGLGVPRETLRLVGDHRQPRLVTTRSGIDHTERMLAWAGEKIEELAGHNLHGFIFKSRSPSSGMERVKVYRPGENPRNVGVGLFARQFMEAFPLLPVEEDGRLHDPRLRENFIERIFVQQRWRALLQKDRSRGGLVAFHTAHKLLIFAHSEKHYREMGRLVAGAKGMAPDLLFQQYENLLMPALKFKATVSKNINVLLHMAGYFKKKLAAEEKKELLDLIEDYRKEYVPLIVPITLMNHFVRKHDERYLAGQYYLAPNPIELKLRNHC